MQPDDLIEHFHSAHRTPCLPTLKKEVTLTATKAGPNLVHTMQTKGGIFVLHPLSVILRRDHQQRDDQEWKCVVHDVWGGGGDGGGL